MSVVPHSKIESKKVVGNCL